MNTNVGVIGLGLIGGSLAKAIKKNTDYRVLGYDIDNTVCHKAKLVGSIHDILTEDMLDKCQIIILALYPAATLEFLDKYQDQISQGATVMDCCGVKQIICPKGEALAKAKGFTFMGGHPMAGLEHAGFDHAQGTLFKEASMVLTPAKGTSIEKVQEIKELCLSIGFTNVEIASPKDHDRIIAYTSQLAHVVSSAYVKSPTAREHAGFSAGSYKDMTRVSKLNEEMWTQLFMANQEFLVDEIDSLIERLKDYSQAIKNQDQQTIYNLLKEGRIIKEEIDKEQF